MQLNLLLHAAVQRVHNNHVVLPCDYCKLTKQITNAWTSDALHKALTAPS